MKNVIKQIILHWENIPTDRGFERVFTIEQNFTKHTPIRSEELERVINELASKADFDDEVDKCYSAILKFMKEQGEITADQLDQLYQKRGFKQEVIKEAKALLKYRDLIHFLDGGVIKMAPKTSANSFYYGKEAKFYTQKK